MRSTSTSAPATNQSKQYGVVHEVHFVVAYNKSGWYITSYSKGSPFRTLGPFEDPINPMEAMSLLVANQTLNQ